jgi:hypothetical protein
MNMTSHLSPEFIADLKQLHEQTIHLELDGATALQLLVYLQVAASHPNPGMRWAMEGNVIQTLAEYLQQWVSITPALAQIAAAGWTQPPPPDRGRGKRRQGKSAPGSTDSERNA